VQRGGWRGQKVSEQRPVHARVCALHGALEQHNETLKQCLSILFPSGSTPPSQPPALELFWGRSCNSPAQASAEAGLQELSRGQETDGSQPVTAVLESEAKVITLLQPISGLPLRNLKSTWVWAHLVKPRGLQGKDPVEGD
jgi:hypothetical protein